MPVRCLSSRYNEEIKVLGKIEKSEMDTGIFRMIAGGKLTLGLGKVKRASVGFGPVANQLGQSCADGDRDMLRIAFLMR